MPLLIGNIMNKDQYIDYLHKEDKLDNKSLNEIKQLLTEYPYFQTFWLLYIKNLHALNDIRYDSQLKIAATYVPDRSRLYELVNDDDTEAKQIPEKEPKSQIKKDQSEEKDIINDKNSEKSILSQIEFKKEPEQVIPHVTSDETDKDFLPDITELKNNISKPTPDHVDQENIIDSDDLFGTILGKSRNTQELNDNYRYSVYDENAISLNNDSANTKKNKKQVLIDKFITEQKGRVPRKDGEPYEPEDLDYTIVDQGFFSETLARIYLKQGHLDKALLTYEKLYLKYPEKSIYFAKQIEKIKELIKNKNS